jgi:hypothetical protein
MASLMDLPGHLMAGDSGFLQNSSAQGRHLQDLDWALEKGYVAKSRQSRLLLISPSWKRLRSSVLTRD